MQTPVSLFTSAPSMAAADPLSSDRVHVGQLHADQLHAEQTDADQPKVAVQQSDAAAVSDVDPVPVSRMPAGDSAAPALANLAVRASTCRLCSLSEARTQVVFGAGNPEADLVFIGEAPGRDEDIRGEPFVGRAGQLLDRMLTAIGMDRDQVYILNTVKCRPPNNRDPRPDEVQACNLWFEQQLDLLQPKMICLLGRVAAQTVLGSDAPLGALRGRWHDYHGVPVWVTYHPAFLLRSPGQKQKGWLDLQTLVTRFRSLSD